MDTKKPRPDLSGRGFLFISSMMVYLVVFTAIIMRMVFPVFIGIAYKITAFMVAMTMVVVITT